MRKMYLILDCGASVLNVATYAGASLDTATFVSERSGWYGSPMGVHAMIAAC